MFRQLLLIYVVAWSFLFSAEGNGQDIQYSQFYANVLYLNPAFAGNSHATRGILHQRIQWPSLDAKYLTSHFSLDHYFSKVNSGAGLMVYKDWQGSNTIATTEVALQYSYELHLSSRFSFRAGVQGSYVSRFINYAILRFPDQYNENGYLGANTQQPSNLDKIHYLDLTSGGIFYAKNYWVGLTYAHMNRPNQSFTGSSSRLPVKWDVTAGYRIDFSSKIKVRDQEQGKDIYLTPTAHYKAQGKSDQVDLGIYFLYDHLITGGWYRGIPLLKQYRKHLQNNESFVVLLGWRIRGLSISYSYDFTLSRLAPVHTGGSHEINVTYIFKKEKKTRITRKIPCPDL